MTGRILAPAIRECSGITASRQHDGVFWVHNDSGNAAQLFAIDGDGTLLCTVSVRGAVNVDWEDITTDDAGNLYVGDFGNNRNERRNLEVLVLREPDPARCTAGETEVTVQRRIPFHFPEQTAFPDPQQMNFDCEALFWLDGSLYVFTKHRSDTQSVLYRLPSGDDTAAQRLGAFDAGGMVTAATLSRDERHLLVLTYDVLHEFTLQEGVPFLDGPHRRMLFEGRQCEAVCFAGKDILILNEQREIMRIPQRAWRQVLLPQEPLARVSLVADVAPEAIDWDGIPTLELTPEYQEGQVPAQAPPRLQLTRSLEALYARIDFRPAGLPPDAGGQLVIVQVGADAGRQARVTRADDTTYDLILSGGQWSASRRPEDDAAPDSASVAQAVDHSWLVVRMPLPGALVREDAALRVNVIVRRPGADGLDEWAWGATSSTRPQENVLLWGRLEARLHR